MIKRYTIVFMLITLVAGALHGQASRLVQQEVLPTNFAHKLLVSKAGAIWVAHDIGLTRYDGSNIKTFDLGRPPFARSMVWDMAEDAQNRIWCTMNNTVYCIQNEKLVLVRKIVKAAALKLLFFKGAMWLTTSDSLIVFDTRTLKGKGFYHLNTGTMNNETNIFAIDGNLFVTGRYSRKVFRFDNDSGFKEVEVSGFNFKNGRDIRSSYFQVDADSPVATVITDDTEAKPDQVVGRVEYIRGTLRLFHLTGYLGSRIMSVSLCRNGEQWIGGTDQIASESGEVIKGKGLFDVAIDHAGNRWFSGPGVGLFFQERKHNLDTLNLRNEQVTALAGEEQYLWVGTASGKIYKYDPVRKHIVKVFHFPGLKNQISFIHNTGPDRFIFGCMGSLHLFNADQSTDKCLDFSSLSGGVFNIAGHIYVADEYYPAFFNQEGTRLVKESLQPAETALLKYQLKAVAYDAAQNVLFIAKPGNLTQQAIGHEEIILYNKSAVIASALYFSDHKLYIFSQKDGLLVWKDHVVSRLLAPNVLMPRRVTKMKKIGQAICLFGNGPAQLIDIKTDTLMANTISFETAVTDIETVSNKIFFISGGQLFSNESGRYKSGSSLVCTEYSIIVNEADTIFKSNFKLSYDENYIAFNLSFPVFTTPEKSYYRYRLIGNKQVQWQSTNPGESSVHFAALKAGIYRFEAKAVHPVLGESSNYIINSFEILEPWWRTWVFKITLVLALLTFCFWSIRSYYVARLFKQKTFFEKELAIEKERQLISREIHDDIGQSLSVIKMNLNMGAPAQLEEAKAVLTTVIKDLRDITHSLYYGKLLIDDLSISIKKDVERLMLLDQFNVTLEFHWEDCTMSNRNQLLVYRIFQEATNNIIKHSGAHNIAIIVEGRRDAFVLSVKDDGRGFDQDTIKNGLGLNNMIQRARLAGGTLDITSSPGEGCEITVNLNIK